MLEIRKLTKRFGGLIAVKDFNLDVEKGKITGLIGPNGSGKTTIFNMISGVYRPTNGEIRLNGRSITGWRPSRIASIGLARTFQLATTFHEQTVYENVKLAHFLHCKTSLISSIVNTATSAKEELEIKRKSLELIEQTGLSDYIDHTAGSLPLGLQRTLGICIALSTSPELLLLDEPAAGMNAEEALKLMSLVQGARNGGITILLVEHNLGLVMDNCDKVAVINFGEKIAEGSPQEISSDEKVIEAYLGFTHQNGYTNA